MTCLYGAAERLCREAAHAAWDDADELEDGTGMDAAGLPRYAMADGRHRVAAALSAGAKSVRCIVRSGDERTEVVARIA